MNRRQRRTEGKRIIERLNVLRNSPLVHEMNLKDIPQDVLDTLIANTCENQVMQKKYNTLKRIADETIRLEIELHNMKVDLEHKLHPTKENVSNID